MGVLQNSCHSEPVRTLAWESPKISEIRRRLPHQSEDWFAMTVYFATRPFCVYQDLAMPSTLRTTPVI